LNDCYGVTLKEARLAQLRAYPEFTLAKLEIADRGSVFCLVEGYAKLLGITHLAAQAGVRHSLSDPYTYIGANVMGLGQPPTLIPVQPEIRRCFRSRLAGLAIATTIVLAASSFNCGTARAEALVLPDSVERAGSIDVIYRFDGPVTGHGLIEAEWTDTVGRVVERRRIPLDLTGAVEAVFSLDPKRAVTVKNRLAVHLSLDETDQSGKPVHREHEEAASFIVSPPDNGWSDYQIIMWQPQTPAGYAALKRIGITAGMVQSDRSDKPSRQVMDRVDAMLDADLRWYLENIATDFYSPYHRWFADRPVNWRFLEAKRRYWVNPQDTAALTREPSLSDPEWLDRIRDRLIGNVSALSRYRPLFYNLADEPGIADVSAFWDFDLSATSLEAMREWLKEQYGDLARLNQEWAASFGSWDAVVPMMTREAIQRNDQNFAAWADFKEWMDVAFARALRSGSDAVHGADPQALSAIEGAQIPGWGGYDYSRLASSVDSMELYDYGENIEMLRSFNPNAVMLTTSFSGGAAEEHRVWRELLRGARGLVLWDDTNQFIAKDGAIGDRGREAAPYFQEIRSGLGAVLINSRSHTDPIAILNSPASMRVRWLMDRKSEGEGWSRRNASVEAGDTSIRISTRNYARVIKHMGLQHRFLSADQVEKGELGRAGDRVLILPGTIALSAGAAKAVRDFVWQGGTVVADTEPGIFDERGRRLTTPALREILPRPASRAPMRFAFGKGQAIYLPASGPGDRRTVSGLGDVLTSAGIEPLASLARSDGRPADDIETYVFENGGVTILVLLRDLDTSRATEPLESPDARAAVNLALPRPYEVYDVRARRRLGLTSRLTLGLGPVAPIVLALSEQQVPGLSISGPRSVRVGETAEFRISPNAVSTAARDIIHIEIVNPNGDVVPHYSGNLVADGGAASMLLPIAANDSPGIWHLHMTDLLSGATATADLVVSP
jgi:hypothetical protein